MENRLKEHRKQQGLSLRAVATRLSLKDHAWISRWETGRTLPSLINAFKLANLYEAPVEELFPGVLEAIVAKRVGFEVVENP